MMYQVLGAYNRRMNRAARFRKPTSVMVVRCWFGDYRVGGSK